MNKKLSIQKKKSPTFKKRTLKNSLTKASRCLYTSWGRSGEKKTKPGEPEDHHKQPRLLTKGGTDHCL